LALRSHWRRWTGHEAKRVSIVAQVFVFGAPRVGQAEFVARYNAAFGPTTYRLVHGRDIVPTDPPAELGFHHVGRYLCCESGERFDSTHLVAASGSDEPSSGSDFFRGVADRLRNLIGSPSPTSRIDVLGTLTLLLAPSIGDHLPDRYYTALTPRGCNCRAKFPAQM
jgi:triacylglycerol lipase